MACFRTSHALFCCSIGWHRTRAGHYRLRLLIHGTLRTTQAPRRAARPIAERAGDEEIQSMWRRTGAAILAAALASLGACGMPRPETPLAAAAAGGRAQDVR